ncbi:site-specific integrase, partial [Blautia pseudococcoides]|nr:site-specific integrase [Blautia pseudococcoides]
MENKIYIKQLGCYQKASEMAKKRMGKNPCFDLEYLPSETMRQEMFAYIMERSRALSAEKLYSEHRFYNHLSQLIQQKGRKLNSFLDWEKDKWERLMKGWMLEKGLPLSHRSKGVYGEEIINRAPTLRYLERLLNFLNDTKEEDEKEKDIWDLDKLGIDIHRDLTRPCRTINFTKIFQPDIRQELKKAIYMHLKTEALGCVQKEMTAIRRFSKYLSEKHSQLESCAE